ncbi:MAG TPA: type IX secretion system sortase PorU, partial [Crocinitomicaceae bacterium]|nr:type IX secretion system sortase PorU [Crocinitomicaceae bacterium]
TKYIVSGAPSNVEIWDITNRTKPIKVEGQLNGFEFTFKSIADTIREFVAFNANAHQKPTFVGQVAPQNLHALDYAEILVVTSPTFLPYANRLANLHRDLGQSVHVVTTEQVFNEFSGGQKDPVAIRQFAKMFYDRANGNQNLTPQNLILFGSGTYDPREITGFPDYVLTYQAEHSETSMSAFTSDDFFVILDDEESFTSADKLDMGVGRMEASTNEEANILLSKVVTYINNMYNGTSTFGDWRTHYAMIADDEDWFLKYDCERVYTKTRDIYPELNATKIYADAYPQQITAGGIRFPQMEADISRKVEEGILLMSYVGHGGPKGGGQERFLNHDQIKSWTNPDKLHLFLSATCDFARLDDPKTISAGTLNLLNPKGGAIALMTTSRSILYNVNSDIDSNFFNVVFTRDANYRPLTLGEIFRQTKNGANNSDNKRSFILIGDPALRLALPKFKVVTDSINGLEISNANIDTLKALSKITIKGHVTDATNSLMSNFNGVIVPSVFDKEKLNKTFGHNTLTTVMDFYTQQNILFRGNVSVVNGKFEFSFFVPKDINYQFGKGKISYYADNDVIDAGGATTDIMVGGINPNGLNDNTPPIIEAYLNDEKFVNGGLTDENPIFKANLQDDFGINAVGNGVGHDITLVLDGDEANPIVLNNYYITDLDSYQSGKINYPMKGVAEGVHKLKLKVWDVNNNPAEFNLDFVVAKKKELSLSHVLNYPNPFTTSTDFYFEHNQFGELLETQIQIFTVSGKLVKTINTYVQTSGFRSEGIHWDGRDDFGDQLAKGVYVYTLTVKNSQGNKAQKTEKLVILK